VLLNWLKKKEGMERMKEVPEQSKKSKEERKRVCCCDFHAYKEAFV